LVGVFVVAAMIGSGALSQNIYNEYNTENYTDPNMEAGTGNLDFQVGLPFIQGVYPSPDPMFPDVTFTMVTVGPDVVWRIGFNATVYTDVYDCWFTTGDMRLNRGAAGEQTMYLGPLALVNLLEITRIAGRVDIGTYNMFSANIVTGEMYIHVVINAWDAWQFIDLAGTGWINVPLDGFPITVYANQVTTYVLGEPLADLILDMF
jgi:hypothetical protein